MWSTSTTGKSFTLKNYLSDNTQPRDRATPPINKPRGIVLARPTPAAMQMFSISQNIFRCHLELGARPLTSVAQLPKHSQENSDLRYTKASPNFSTEHGARTGRNNQFSSAFLIILERRFPSRIKNVGYLQGSIHASSSEPIDN